MKHPYTFNPNAPAGCRICYLPREHEIHSPNPVEKRAFEATFQTKKDLAEIERIAKKYDELDT
jgi:hypothetical protein